MYVTCMCCTVGSARRDGRDGGEHPADLMDRDRRGRQNAWAVYCSCVLYSSCIVTVTAVYFITGSASKRAAARV